VYNDPDTLRGTVDNEIVIVGAFPVVRFALKSNRCKGRQE
jgi:hypothetical protein